MKPSDDPRSPFSPHYKAKINWRPQQQSAQNKANVTIGLEKKRLEDVNYDKKVGMLFNKDRGENATLPKQFSVFR